MIGGNTNLALQVKTTAKNVIGERVAGWETVQTLFGWVDYQSGDSQRTSYNSKIEQSTHFFIGDYVEIDPRIKDAEGNYLEQNCRAIHKGKVYEILIIDNPMGMNRQIEIFLKYTGGQI